MIALVSFTAGGSSSRGSNTSRLARRVLAQYVASINLLRILQKLTKNKPTRIRTLVQYKAPVRSFRRSIYYLFCLSVCQFACFGMYPLLTVAAQVIMKRLLRIEHPLLRLYTLKVLKSQVRYLGRKWRMGALVSLFVVAVIAFTHTVIAVRLRRCSQHEGRQ